MGVGVKVDQARRVGDHVEYRIVLLFYGDEPTEAVWRRFRDMYAVFAEMKTKYPWTPEPPSRTPFRRGFWFRLSDDEVRKRRLHIQTHLRALISCESLLRETALRELIGYNRALLGQVLANVSSVLQGRNECVLRARYMSRWLQALPARDGHVAEGVAVLQTSAAAMGDDLQPWRSNGRLSDRGGAGSDRGGSTSPRSAHKSSATSMWDGSASPQSEPHDLADLSRGDTMRLLKRYRKRLRTMQASRAPPPARTHSEGAAGDTDVPVAVSSSPHPPRAPSVSATTSTNNTSNSTTLSIEHAGLLPRGEAFGSSLAELSMTLVNNAPYDAAPVTNPCLPLAVAISFTDTRNDVVYYRVDVDDGGPDGVAVWKRYTDFCCLRDELLKYKIAYDSFPTKLLTNVDSRRSRLETWLQTVVANADTHDGIKVVEAFLEPPRARVKETLGFEAMHLSLCPYQSFQFTAAVKEEAVLAGSDDGSEEDSDFVRSTLLKTRAEAAANGTQDGADDAPLRLKWDTSIASLPGGVGLPPRRPRTNGSRREHTEEEGAMEPAPGIPVVPMDDASQPPAASPTAPPLSGGDGELVLPPAVAAAAPTPAPPIRVVVDDPPSAAAAAAGVAAVAPSPSPLPSPSSQSGQSHSASAGTASASDSSPKSATAAPPVRKVKRVIGTTRKVSRTGAVMATTTKVINQSPGAPPRRRPSQGSSTR